MIQKAEAALYEASALQLEQQQQQALEGPGLEPRQHLLELILDFVTFKGQKDMKTFLFLSLWPYLLLVVLF